MPKNKYTDAAAENASADSLSFAGLVCIQDQQSKSQNIHLSTPPPANNSAKILKLEDIDFEFGSTISGSTGPVDTLNNNNSPADVLFSDGQLVPQAIQLHTSRSQVLERANSSRCNDKKAIQLHTTSRSQVLKRANSPRHNDKKANVSAKKTNKQQATASQRLGQKIIQSLATPCRNCRAIQPSPPIKQQALRQ